MKKLPITLIYSRLLIGAVLILLSIVNASHYAVWSITLIAVGLLTDIFDGIIARWLGISNEHLRRLDSTIDGIFLVCSCVVSFY